MIRHLLVSIILTSCLLSQEIETFVVSRNIDIDQSFNFTIKIKDIDVDPEVDISPMLDNFLIIMGPNIVNISLLMGKRALQDLYLGLSYLKK